MVYKCKNCDTALRYDPASKVMVCHNCGSTFQTEEMNSVEDSNEMMELDIYSCTTCGAELAVNDVEASTFCAYCGQPTVVFSRVSCRLKPSYIIPFQIDKNTAEMKIREKLRRGFFVPQRIRNFEVERLCGIYVPFWLFDIYYHNRQIIRGGDDELKYYFREGEVRFKNIPVDASKQLLDETSQRLEPFDISHKREFHVAYMSGFYADCYDVTYEDALMCASRRAGKLYDDEILKTVEDDYLEIYDSKPEFKELKKEYIMFPVWFLTFRYKDKPFTFLMNGQSGKIIGAVPVHKGKAVALFVILASVFSILIYPFTAVGVSMFVSMEGNFSKLLLSAICSYTLIMLVYGLHLFRNTIKSIALTKRKSTSAYVRNRQEDK